MLALEKVKRAIHGGPAHTGCQRRNANEHILRGGMSIAGANCGQDHFPLWSDAIASLTQRTTKFLGLMHCALLLLQLIATARERYYINIKLM